MPGKIGLLGLMLVGALVVSTTADQPLGYPPAAERGADLTEAEMEQYLQAYKRSPRQPSPQQMTPQQMTTAPAAPVPMMGGVNSPQTGSAGELIGFSGFDGSGSQTITLVHARKMQIAVYHIDGSGQIQLISSRPIDADFSITLNPVAPLPKEIRLLGGVAK